MRRQDWAFGAAVWGLWRTGVHVVRGDFIDAIPWAIGGLLAAILARYWSRKYPAPMPYALRWTLYLSRPGHSARRLARALNLQEGEHLLEIGPGIGLNALSIAAKLNPGILDVLDVQQPMLDSLMQRAARRGITNINPHLGDARRLPFDDHTFDAAYLMGVLGEIPEPDRALRELRRVLKPAGRLAVGEFMLDPDFVSLRVLRRRLEEAGFKFAKSFGLIAYIARFDVPRLAGEAQAA